MSWGVNLSVLISIYRSFGWEKKRENSWILFGKLDRKFEYFKNVVFGFGVFVIDFKIIGIRLVKSLWVCLFCVVGMCLKC